MEDQNPSIDEIINDLEDFAIVNNNKLCQIAASKLLASYGVNKTLMKANMDKVESLKREKELTDNLMKVIISQINNEPDSQIKALNSIKIYNAIRDEGLEDE